MPEAIILTTKEVARLCRVSDATVKRWEDAGLLRSERTSGRHRRFRAEEVARFQREQKISVAQFARHDSIIKTAAKAVDATHLWTALINGREAETAEILIHSYLREPNLAELFDQIVCAAMREVGEKWMSGEITIAQEHLATRHVINALQRLRQIVPVEHSNQTAICCAVEDDFHELPVLLAQIILESAGWQVVNFGANLPFHSLGAEIVKRKPELVCISVTVINELERAALDYRTLQTQICKLNAKVVFGGRAFADERIKKRFPADLHADSFARLLEFAQK